MNQPKAKSSIRVDLILAATMELVLLVMVCLSPWAFGAVEAEYCYWLYVGLGVLLALWAVRMVAQWRVVWKPCPVAMCLAAVFVVGIFQLTPLPGVWLHRLSPATAGIYGRLLPSQPEEFSQAASPELSTARAGTTISLYPDATRNWLVKLLAVFLLFVFVRNNITSAAAMRRLCVVALINGAVLSLFGLVQFFSSEPGMIYWDYPTSGTPFGPYVNRNHFAFYINLCVGLGLGLLLSCGQAAKMAGSGQFARPIHSWQDRLRGLLHDPAALWICVGLALMLSGVVFCLSRGGFLALLGAGTVGLLLALFRGRRDWKLGTALLSVAAALALLVWFGLDAVQDRLSTLWTGEAFEEDRVFLLSRAWPVIHDFPLWGSGQGTFQFIEPFQFHTLAEVGRMYKHAHNDYLEDLVEGGVIRLAMRLAIIFLIFRFGDHAFRHARRTSDGALALGGLFAFTMMVIHSFFEFGLYMPSIALLAAVLSAHLCSLGEACVIGTSDLESDPADTHEAIVDPHGMEGDTIRLWGIAPVFGAAVAVSLGWFLYTEGARAASIEGLRWEARVKRELALGGSLSHQHELPYLDEAARLNPRDAEVQFLLAEAHFALDKEQSSGQDNGADRIAADGKDHVALGLRHVLRSRDLCPLLPAPHARLAAYRDHLNQADTRVAYMDRAKFLAPMDPQLWYFCGMQELADGEPEQAYKSWRRSLELSDRYLTRILDRSALSLSPDEILRQLLPEHPDRLLAAALHFFPQAEMATQRQPFLERALLLLDSHRPLSPKDLHTKATIHLQLGQLAEAMRTFQAALAQEPQETAWRFEFAQLLYDQGRSQEARRELRRILDQKPRHSAARRLADILAREAAEGEKDNPKRAPSGRE